jgi:hypothetical protein
VLAKSHITVPALNLAWFFGGALKDGDLWKTLHSRIGGMGLQRPKRRCQGMLLSRGNILIAKKYYLMLH